MIYKQTDSEIQTVQISQPIEILAHILKAKHLTGIKSHLSYINFNTYFGNFCHPKTWQQKRAKDKLIFAQDKQMLKKMYSLSQIVKNVKECILNRVSSDRVAPFINISPQNMVVFTQLNNRQQAIGIESNTMHSSSSVIRKNWKKSGKQFKSKGKKMLNQFGNIINNVTGNEKKYKSFKVHFNKGTMYKSDSRKSIKKASNQPKYTSIRSQTQNCAIKYEHPEYMLRGPTGKKYERSRNKLKSKSKSKQFILSSNKRIAEGRRNSARCLTQKQQLTPMTPKSISSAKMFEAWSGSLNKTNKKSSKSVFQNEPFNLNSNKKKGGTKSAKSPVFSKKSPNNQIKNLPDTKSPKKILKKPQQ